jgi:hypothetical protein
MPSEQWKEKEAKETKKRPTRLTLETIIIFSIQGESRKPDNFRNYCALELVKFPWLTLCIHSRISCHRKINLQCVWTTILLASAVTNKQKKKAAQTYTHVFSASRDIYKSDFKCAFVFSKVWLLSVCLKTRLLYLILLVRNRHSNALKYQQWTPWCWHQWTPKHVAVKFRVHNRVHKSCV